MSGYKFSTLPLTWQEATLPYGDRLRSILESWKGTPYLVCQQEKGVGVDCVRFVAAVWDELLGRGSEPIDRLSRDASLNNPKATRDFMRILLERYSPVVELTGQRVVEPGDVLVVHARGGGPGHVIMVGPDRNTTWQADTRKVIMSGWALMDRFQILSHWFRFGDRRLWLTQQPSPIS